MAICSFFIMGIAAVCVQGAGTENVVLDNKHLAVTFEPSDAGPRLRTIEHRATGTTYRFGDSQEISMFLVRPEVIHDATLSVQYALQNDFQFDHLKVDADGTRVLFRFRHELVQADITYELDPVVPIFRKTIVCRAAEKGVYVAGVRQWMLKPVGLPLAWPKSGRWTASSTPSQTTSGSTVFGNTFPSELATMRHRRSCSGTWRNSQSESMG